MGIYQRVLRKVGTWAVVGSLGAGGVWLTTQAHGPEARAQAPAASAPSAQRDKIYTNKNLFHLPVQIDPKTRGNLREIRLYVKVGAAEWVQQETGQPSITHFTYRAGQDAEYWFSVVTVDRNGRQTPPDISQEAPGLMVVVDTQEPGLDLQPVALGGETLLRCAMQDAHPDLATVKMVYRGNDQMDHIIEPLPNRPGYFRVPAEAWNRPVLVKGADRCGNSAVSEFQLRNPQMAKQTPPSATPPAPTLPDRLPNIQNDDPPLPTLPDNVVTAGAKNDVPAPLKQIVSRETAPSPTAMDPPESVAPASVAPASVAPASVAPASVPPATSPTPTSPAANPPTATPPSANPPAPFPEAVKP